MKIRRILLSRLRFMGDVILTTPLLPALKERFPRASIDYLAEPPYLELLQNNPFLHDLIPFERKLYAGSSVFQSTRLQYRFIQKLRDKRYDLGIDLLGIPRSAGLFKLAKIPVRVGGGFRYRSHLFTHCFDPDRGWRSAIDFHALALKRLGIEASLGRPVIYLTESERSRAQEYLQQRGLGRSRPIIGLHPGATWPAKIWPTARFARLANRILRELKCHVFITRGPDEAPIVDELKKELSSQVVIGEVLPLRRLAALLSQFAVYISNDCGPMHLAIAVDTPTIGIFGPSEPEIWFPYPKTAGHRVLFKEIECRPCHLDICPIQHQCMDRISVNDTFVTLKDVMEHHVS